MIVDCTEEGDDDEEENMLPSRSDSRLLNFRARYNPKPSDKSFCLAAALPRLVRACHMTS